MKSSKVDVKAKLSVWSGIALMALALSSGKPVLAAEDIKLWHNTQAKHDQLLHLEEKDTSKNEVTELILGKEEKEADLKKFVEKFSKEPVQLLESVKEAWAKIDKEDKTEEKNKVKEFKEKLLKDLENLDVKAFGSDHRKEVLLTLVKKLFDKKLDDKTLIGDLLKDPRVLLALEITDKEPKKEEKKDEKNDVKNDVKNDEKKDDRQPAPDTKTDQKQSPIGEQGNDEKDRLMAQQICDAIKGRENSFSQKEAELQKLMDAANQLLNARAAESSIRPEVAQNKKNEKGLDEILPGLLANALGQQDKNDEITPAPNNTQPFVPSNNRNNQTDPSQFNQPLPQQDQPQQQAPFFLPPNTNPGVQTPVKLDLPSSSGQQELRDAQAITAQNEGRTPISSQLNMYSTPQDILGARVKVRTDIQKAQIALQNAKDRASKLDEQLEELKDGGRSALSPEVKKQQAQLQSDVDTAKRNYDQQRQMLMMVAPEQRDQLQGMLMTMQQDLNFKEQKLSQFNAQVDVAIEDGNKQIKKLAKVRDSLNSEVNKLNTQLAGMKEDEQGINQIMSQQQQMQMAQMQGGNGVQNVNNGARLQGFSGNLGTPRTLGPARLGGILGKTQAGNAGAVRGSLGAK